MTKSNEVSYWAIALIVGISLLFSSPALIASLLRHPIGLPCQTHAIDGRLGFYGRSAYIVSESRERRTLFYGVKGGHVGPMNNMRDLKPDSPIRAEFCGKDLVIVTISGKQIFRLTQESVDLVSNREKKLDIGIMIVLSLTLLFCIFKLWKIAKLKEAT